MKHITELIDQRMIELKQVIREKEVALLNAPEGILNIAGSKHNPYYYYKKTSSDKNKRYLKTSERHLVEELCQKEYDLKVLQAAHKELRLMKFY